MTKKQALAMAERLNRLTCQQQILLDKLWLLSKEAGEVRTEMMKYMREQK